MPIAVDVPLDDDELDVLEERGLDVHYALGVIHAVGVAPGMIPTPQWLPLAFGNVPPDQTTIGLVLRLYNQVIGMLAKGREVMIPEAEDGDECVAFASGYVAAASLDPAWVGHSARWTFAAPLAFLAERHDLVPAGFLDKVPNREEAREVALRDLGKLVYAAYQSFAKERLAICPGRARPRSKAPRSNRTHRAQRAMPVRVRQEIQALLHRTKRVTSRETIAADQRSSRRR